MATGATKMSYNAYQNGNGKFNAMAGNSQKDMEVTQDMHLKMSKKIAQLTKVNVLKCVGLVVTLSCHSSCSCILSQSESVLTYFGMTHPPLSSPQSLTSNVKIHTYLRSHRHGLSFFCLHRPKIFRE